MIICHIEEELVILVSILLRQWLCQKMVNPLAGLYYKTPFGYKGVEMPGFPRTVLWNDKYLISKNYDGNNSAFFCYVIINQDSVNASDGNIENIRVFITETDYYTYLQQIGLSESNMNQTDNHIAWWEVIL